METDANSGSQADDRWMNEDGRITRDGSTNRTGFTAWPYAEVLPRRDTTKRGQTRGAVASRKWPAG